RCRCGTKKKTVKGEVMEPSPGPRMLFARICTSHPVAVQVLQRQGVTERFEKNFPIEELRYLFPRFAPESYETCSMHDDDEREYQCKSQHHFIVGNDSIKICSCSRARAGEQASDDETKRGRPWCS